MPRRNTPAATAATTVPVAAPVATVAAPKGPLLTEVPATFAELEKVVVAAVTAAQEAKALAAAFRLVGGKGTATSEVAVGSVSKFHDAALAKFVGDAKFRAKALDAAASASPYTIDDIVSMVRGIVLRDDIVHPKVMGIDGKTPTKGGAVRDIRKAPECFRFAAMARIDSLPFLPGKGLIRFITDQA